MSCLCRLPICSALMLLATTATAQESTTTPQEGTASEPREVTFESYDPRLSWPLFAACDKDSDDRIDLFEAQYGVVGLVQGQQTTAFRLLDLSKDGFLQWAEFDLHYRESIRSSAKFTVRLQRPLVVPFDPTVTDRASSLEAALLRLVDRNDDQQLAPREYRNFIVDAELGAEAKPFPEVDLDDSGFLTLDEFQKVLALLPDSGAAMIRAAEESPDSLPPGYREVDVDRDDLLDLPELTAALVAIDPSLRRWSEQILEAADFSRNGRLSRTEIDRASNK